MNQTLYQEHLDAMFRVPLSIKYSDTEVEQILDRLLQCLPNNGKFYKYRSINGKSFQYAYDSLQKGYLWLPKASELNDDLDTTLEYDPAKSMEEIKNYIFQHPVLVIQAVLRSPDGWHKLCRNAIEKISLEKIMACFDPDTRELNEKKAETALIGIGCPLHTAINYIAQTKQFVPTYIERNEESFKKLARDHLSYNHYIRTMSYVFSVSEEYDNDQMWAYYANNNLGFCIEYDFCKVKNLSPDLKRKMISFFKVIYNDHKQPFKFAPLLEWYLAGKEPPELFSETNYSTMVSLITKTENWKHEKEWRLLLTDTDQKLFADLVSGMILDDRVLKKTNAKKLIALAKKRNWSIRIRKSNLSQTTHIYKQWSEQT